MKKDIITKLIDGCSIEDVYVMMENIPLEHIQDTIEKIEEEFRNRLNSCSSIVHMSMQSHHNAGNIDNIRKEFAVVEDYLKFIVYDRLSIYEKLFMSFVRFFSDYSPEEEIQECIRKIYKNHREITIYNDLLRLKSKDFLKYIEAYNNWIIVLTQFVPKFIDKHGLQKTDVSYTISKIIMRASELLMTHRQLESTISLQTQNNQLILADITHIVTVTQSLMQNTLSTKNFFEQEYVGSLKIIKKYGRGIFSDHIQK